MTGPGWAAETGWPGVLPVVLVICALGCGDSTDSGPDPVDVTGSWELTTTLTSNNCGLPNGETNTEVILITGTGAELAIITFDGHWGAVETDGNSVSFTGSESSDDFGCLATLATEGTGGVSGNTIVGTLSTTVSFDPGLCDYDLLCDASGRSYA